MLPLISGCFHKRERCGKMNKITHFDKTVLYFSAYCSTVVFYQDVPFHRRYLKNRH